MRRTKLEDETRSCATCEANLICQWVNGIAKSDRKNYICKNYANARQGYNWDANRNRRVEE